MEARNQVQVSREALAEIVGRPITEPLSRVRNDVALQAPTRPLQNWVTQAVENNPLLKSYQSGAEAANAAVREGKGEHYPQLSLSLSAQQNDQGYDNTQAPRSDSYVASFGVKIPIYSGGSTSARVRGLYDDQLAAEEQLEGVRRQVVKETTTAYLTAQAAVEKSGLTATHCHRHSIPVLRRRRRSPSVWSMLWMCLLRCRTSSRRAGTC